MTTRFAEIKTSDNTVLRVIGEADVINGVNVIDWRTKPANISDIWQEDNQRFISQKTSGTPNSYTLNETTGLYDPPVAEPTAATPVDATASWNESNLRWELTLTDSTEQYWDPNTSTYIDI